MAVLLCACDDSGPPPLREVEVRPLPTTAATTLALDDSGRIWLGEPGRMVVVSDGGVIAVHPAPAGDAPRVSAWLGARAYLSGGDSLLVAPRPDTLGVRGGMTRAVLAVDPRGRFLLQGAGSGAVLAHDTATLEPLWGWGAVDAATTSLALSPIGDRLYQAVHREGEDPLLLERDLQTGRTLASHTRSRPLTALTATTTGRLYGVEGEEDRLVVVALEAGRDGMAEVWRQRVEADAGDEARVAVAGGRVVGWGGGVRWGVVVLDPESGEVVRRAGEEPIDVALDPAGSIWALYPGEVRRLE